MASDTLPIEDPFEFLSADHRKVEELFAKIEATSRDAESERTELFTRLNAALTLHSELEEGTLYPMLKKKEETRDHVLESVEEHQVVKTLLSEISGTSPSDEEWIAQVTVLRENVEHHVKEEEGGVLGGGLFGKAQSVLSDEEIENLARDMNAFLSQRAV